MCNTSITEDDMVKAMDNRVIVIENDWFIPKFLKFQYVGLQSNKPVIVSVVTELEKNGYFKYIPESFGNDYIIIKDKDKDKDKLVKQKTELNGKQFVNFKTQGEELFAKRDKQHRDKANGL